MVKSVQARINEANLLSKRGRLVDFLMSLALCLMFVLTTLGRQVAMFRSWSVDSTSNKFEKLTTAVVLIPVMSSREWFISA